MDMQPELRFKDDNGQPFPEWDERRLGDVAVRSTVKNSDELITEVLTNSAVEGVVSQRDYFDKDIATQGNLQNYYIVNLDDFETIA